jgi:hypothetical protein
MKTCLRLNLTVFTIVVALFGFGCKPSQESAGHPIIVIYPSPGDLSDVEGLEESPLFDLSVDGTDTFVYRGYEEEFNKYGFAKKGGAYVDFAFEGGPITVDIRTTQAMKGYSVKPTLEAVEQVSPTHLRVTLDKPQKFLVTADFEELGENWFVVAADAPDAEIDPDDPTVLYLGPGVHYYGKAWDPFVEGKKTLYVAGGAVVQATIHCVGKDGVSIKGPGLFSQAFRPHARREPGFDLQCEWFGECMGMYFRDCKNLTFEGYSLINCPSYQLEVANCDNVTIRNVKLLGFGENNNDGVHMYSRDVLMEDCFIAGNDDRVCITGLYDSEDREVKVIEDQQKRITDTHVGNLTIRDTIFWGQKNGGDIMLSWNGGKTLDSVLIENIQSLGKTNKGFLAARHGGSVLIHDVTIRNVHLYHTVLCSLEVLDARTWGAGGGAIRDITVENVTIDADPKEIKKLMTGWSEESSISNIVFKNLRAIGQKITSLAQTGIETNEFVKGVRFE